MMDYKLHLKNTNYKNEYVACVVRVQHCNYYTSLLAGNYYYNYLLLQKESEEYYIQKVDENTPTQSNYFIIG